MKSKKKRRQKKVGKRDRVAEKGKEGRRIKTETERVRDERQKGIRECDRRERKEQREKDRIEGKREAETARKEGKRRERERLSRAGSSPSSRVPLG